MARDFKTSVIFPNQTAAAAAMGCVSNPAQVFRTGFNTFTCVSNNAASTLTAKSSDYFFIDEQIADQLLVTSVSDGTKGDSVRAASSATTLGYKLTPTAALVTGVWTSTGHGLVQGQTIIFTSITGGGGVFKPYRPYVVQYINANTFYLTERWSTVILIPVTAAITASVAYVTNASNGLGPTGVPGQAGTNPEPLPGMYVRPMYLRCVVQPNFVASNFTTQVSVQNLTVTVLGSHVRGYDGTAGGIADQSDVPYATVASKTFQQVFFEGTTGNVTPNTGCVFTMPIQTDYPFLRFQLSFGKTETSTTGTLDATASYVNVGLSLVTGRENAQA